MTVPLELEPEVEMTASEQAREKGLPLAEYVESVVKEVVLKRQRVQNCRKSLSMKFSNRSEMKSRQVE